MSEIKSKRPPASKSMENERTATTKAKEGRVEKLVVERLKRKKPKRTTNPGGEGWEPGMGLYLNYHTRSHPLPSDGEVNQSKVNY